jgi:hypothetical protein
VSASLSGGIRRRSTSGSRPRSIAPQTASGSIRSGRTNHMTTKIASVGIATKPGNSTSTRDAIA